MKIKILHITKMKGVSGSENHLRTLLSAIDHARFDLTLCILAEPQHVSLLKEYQQALSDAGVTVIILTMRRYADPSLFWRLRRLMVQGRYDIVHTHLIHADLYGTIAAQWAGVNTIFSSKHNDDRFRRNKVMNWLNATLTRRHTKIIVISDWIGTFYHEVEGIPLAKIVRIHYGLHPETISRHADPGYIRQQFHVPEHVPIIATIGQRYLLQAIKQILPQFPNLRVFLIGDGELRGELETQTVRLGMAENIVFTGYRTDAQKLISGCDIFAFPSLWEGFGLVLLEAMALKKAIVASCASAIPESVVHGQTGLLVPPKDVEALAQAILMLLRDPQLSQKMGESGFKRLQTHFTVENMVRKTERLYLETLR